MAAHQMEYNTLYRGSRREHLTAADGWRARFRSSQLIVKVLDTLHRICFKHPL